MLTSWYDCLSKSASWWTILLALALTAVCVVGFQGRTLALQRAGKLGKNEKLLDGRWWYTPEDAAELLGKLGEDGRRLYRVSALTLDLIFPIAYGLSLALLLVRLWPREQSWLLLLPFVAVIADVVENVIVAILTWTYSEGHVSPLAKVAAVFTLTKWIFFYLALLALVIGLVRAPFRGFGSAAGAGASSGASPY